MSLTCISAPAVMNALNYKAGFRALGAYEWTALFWPTVPFPLCLTWCGSWHQRLISFSWAVSRPGLVSIQTLRRFSNQGSG